MSTCASSASVNWNLPRHLYNPPSLLDGSRKIKSNLSGSLLMITFLFLRSISSPLGSNHLRSVKRSGLDPSPLHVKKNPFLTGLRITAFSGEITSRGPPKKRVIWRERERFEEREGGRERRRKNKWNKFFK